MTPTERREFDKLRREIVELRQRTANLPVRLPRIPNQRPILAKITGVGTIGDGEGNTDGYYKATEQVWDDSTNEWIDKTNGRTWDGTSENLPELYEVNATKGVVNDVIVKVKKVSGDDGELHWLFDVGGGLFTSAPTVGTTDETEAAATDEWDREDQAENAAGVKVNVLTRMAYDNTGDEKLYAYYRRFDYDSMGHLIAVGQETRVTIDTPESCT